MDNLLALGCWHRHSSYSEAFGGAVGSDDSGKSIVIRAMKQEKQNDL